MPPLLSYSLDILRLIAIPVFFWAAYKDIKTRRVSNNAWLFLAGVGLLLLAADALIVELGLPTHRYPPTFWRSVALSLFAVIPLAYLSWALGLFGGADAKALMALAILFPVTPSYSIDVSILGYSASQLPEYTFPVSIFAFTIFANAILLSMLYPAVMALRNVINRNFEWPMVLARPLSLLHVTNAHGVLFETPDGFGRSLDLDILRAYLDWRDTTIDQLSPVTAVEEHTEANHDTEGGTLSLVEKWDVEAFLEQRDGPTYGMTADAIANGLEVLDRKQETNSAVWVSPGIPYMVPFAVGLCVALTYGNLMIALLILLQ